MSLRKSILERKDSSSTCCAINAACPHHQNHRPTQLTDSTAHGCHLRPPSIGEVEISLILLLCLCRRCCRRQGNDVVSKSGICRHGRQGIGGRVVHAASYCRSRRHRCNGSAENEGEERRSLVHHLDLGRRWWEITIVGPDLQRHVRWTAFGAVSCLPVVVVSDCGGTSDHKSDRPSTTFTRNFNSHESNSTAHHRANLLGSPSASFCVAGCYYPRVTTKAIRFMYTSPFLSAPAGQFHPQPTNLHAPTSFILVIGPFFRSKIGHSRSESLSKFGNTLSATSERECKAQKPWLFPLRHEARVSLVRPPRSSWSTSWTITT